MKYLVSAIIGLTLFTSCGKVERPDELFDFLDTQKAVDSNKGSIDSNKENINKIEESLNKYYAALDNMASDINNLEINQDNLSNLISTNIATISTLETGSTVVEIIDPCGDNIGYFDEVLLVLSDGSIIAYVEQKGKRFLSQLVDGHYSTTDKQKCNFSVVLGEYLEIL